MKNNTLVKSFAAGAGAAAAIAGIYFLYGSKNAAKNQKKVKSWMLMAKGEVLERLENISEVSEDVYSKIVEEVSGKYEALKNISKDEVAEFANELKAHWKNITKELSVPIKKSSKSKK